MTKVEAGFTNDMRKIRSELVQHRRSVERRSRLGRSLRLVLAGLGAFSLMLALGLVLAG